MRTHPNRLTLSAALLLASCGTALGQNALGSGRALDGGLSATPGGRINAPVQDLQAIVRYNTNAGNALNGPGYVNTRGGASVNPSAYSLESMRLGSGSITSATLGNMRNFELTSRGGLRGFDSVGAIEAGYLPGGALTSAVALPQGTTPSVYSRANDESVGYLRNNQGAVLVARGSTLRGISIEPLDPNAMLAPGVPPITLATDATYGRVLDDLRRASLARTPGPVNRIDNNATPSPVEGAPPATAASGEAAKPPTGTTPPSSTTPGVAGKPAGPDPAETIKRLREQLNAAKPSPTPQAGRSDKPAVTTKPDPSNTAATPALSEEDIAALRAMGVRLDTLVPAGSSDAQASDGYTRLGQEALAAGRFGLADQMFQSALSRSPGNVLARVGNVHATMGLGLLMTAGTELRAFLVDHPEMIPVRYDVSLLMPRGRADRLADMLTADIDRPDGGLLPESGLTLAYLGRQFENATWLNKGFSAMAIQTKNDPQGAELMNIVSKVWSGPATSQPTAPTPARPEPAGPKPVGAEPTK